VNPRWIVSGAHCFVWNWQGRFTFTATAAQHNWRVESGDEQIRNVVRIVNHPNYDNQGGTIVSEGFDINVVQVDRDFILNALVGTISLPPRNFIHSGDAQAFGWGSFVPVPPPSLPDILQTTTVDIIPFESCREIFNVIDPNNPLHFTDMCTGPLDGSTGTCNADSGGPLVQNNTATGNLELIGVVAWGPSPCNSPDFPSVLSRVSAFIDFINENVN
jgi:secreted trypsin-like serine protease